MRAPGHDPERSWRKGETPAGGKSTVLKAADLVLDIFELILDLLDAIF